MNNDTRAPDESAAILQLLDRVCDAAQIPPGNRLGRLAALSARATPAAASESAQPVMVSIAQDRNFCDLIYAWGQLEGFTSECAKAWIALINYIDQLRAANRPADTSQQGQPVAKLIEALEAIADRSAVWPDGRAKAALADFRSQPAPVAVQPAGELPPLPLLPPVPQGDRFKDETAFRLLGRGGLSNLYECWDDAIYKYAQDYAREAVRAARQAPTKDQEKAQ